MRIYIHWECVWWKKNKEQGYNVWYCNIGGIVDDGIAMGHFGMKYSLASRELITDQIETLIERIPCDAWIGIETATKLFQECSMPWHVSIFLHSMFRAVLCLPEKQTRFD